jgi:hypothetical protein
MKVEIEVKDFKGHPTMYVTSPDTPIRLAFGANKAEMFLAVISDKDNLKRFTDFIESNRRHKKEKQAEN